jgi:hypothetical protein
MMHSLNSPSQNHHVTVLPYVDDINPLDAYLTVEYDVQVYLVDDDIDTIVEDNLYWLSYCLPYD